MRTVLLSNSSNSMVLPLSTAEHNSFKFRQPDMSLKLHHFLVDLSEGKYIAVYQLNLSLQPFNQCYNLASHTIYVVCVCVLIFIPERRNLYFNFDRFEKHFIYSQILYCQSFEGWINKKLCFSNQLPTKPSISWSFYGSFIQNWCQYFICTASKLSSSRPTA